MAVNPPSSRNATPPRWTSDGHGGVTIQPDALAGVPILLEPIASGGGIEVDVPAGYNVGFDSFAYFFADFPGNWVEIKGNGDFSLGAQKVGFYAAAPVSKQTGVAVTAAAIHAALVNLGLIGA